MTPQIYRIGVHAQRNAGKTCLFACLYGLRARLNESVAFDDEPTLVYLRQTWAFIQNGTVPPATSMAKPAEMVFRLDHAGESFEIVSADYSGALVEPSEDETSRALSDEARAWIRSCDAILVLGDSAAPEVAQLDAAELLLAELARDGGDPKPLALVLTKWDVHGEPSPDPAEEAERLEQYLVAHPVFARIHQALKESAADPKQAFAVFPVSAFGQPGPGPGMAPPAEAMRPHRLTEPWAWAARQVARVAESRRAAARRRRLSILAAAALLAVIAFAGVFRWADARDAREYRDLAEWHETPRDASVAEEIVERENQYLAAWWSRVAPGHRKQVQAWLVEDGERAEAHRQEVERWRRRRRHDELAAAIERDALAMTDRGEDQKAWEMCQSFVTDFADSAKLNAVKAIQATVRDRWDGRVWLDVTSSRTKYVEHARFEELAALVADYMRIPAARNRRDAERLLQDAEWEVDRVLYGRLLDQSRKPASADQLLATARKADEYLRVPRKRHQMDASVRKWKDWWDALNGPGMQFVVRVRRIALASDTNLSSFWGLRPVLVVIVGDRQTRTTRTYRGKDVTTDETLSPLEFRWGDKGPLRLRVENAARTSLKAELEFPASDFPLTALNGEHVLTDAARKTVTVVVECAEAVPPKLPEYGVKE